MSDMSLEDKFMNNTKSWLEHVGNLLDDLNAAGLTKYDSSPIESATAVMSLMKKEKLISFFIAGHEYWEMIAKRDITFVTNEIPKIYGKATVDVKAIVEPAKVYLTLKNKGVYNKSKDEAEWPINDEDITRQWKLFDAMVNLSCRYAHGRKNNPPKVLEEVDYHIKAIDLAKYGAMFKVTY